MAKKTATRKRTANRSAPKADVNKTQAVKRVLARTPDKPPRQISEQLAGKGIDVTPAYVSNIKSNIKKAEAEISEEPRTDSVAAAPERKSVSGKRTTKKKIAAKKKVRRKKQVAKEVDPETIATSKITYEKLQQAKELARQLGGLNKAREALTALSNLQE